jgi:hypothetical protein
MVSFDEDAFDSDTASAIRPSASRLRAIHHLLAPRSYRRRRMDVVDEQRVLEWLKRRELDRDLGVCPSCAHHSIDAASPFGFCAKCTADRLIEEDDGRRPRARLRQRLRPDPVCDDPIETAYLDDIACQLLEHYRDLVDLCTRCGRRPRQGGWFCKECDAEAELEIEVPHMREKARQRSWWAEFGNEWRQGRRVAAKAPAAKVASTGPGQ